MDYRQVHDRSLSNPEDFWAEAADAIDWDRRWDSVLSDDGGPFQRWFAGGRLNTCYNALDRHVDNGRADQIALIHDSPVTDTIQRFSYRELRDQVARLAGALRAHGVNKG
ncbi:MAG TPA: acetyl-coenzyme A synthetase N-terminal domain-containing protein, partial [Wenzhouxiangellaceae bacterium]|nr:acetyl-coenzyme A synthetase N-terminal domain-containing protein [Wenzhouxiangellaceae bacterium]